MDLLYTLKFQRSFRSLLNVLYIMGVAKAATRTHKLNKIPLSRFYKDSVSMSKKRVNEIFNKLGIEYKIVDDMVFFGNGFNVELNEKYYSGQKQDYDKLKKEMEILSSFGGKNDEDDEDEEVVKQIYDKIKNENENIISTDDSQEEFNEPEDTDDENAWEDFPTEPAEDIDSILDIGEGHFQWETFEKLYDFNRNVPYAIDNEYGKLKVKFDKLTGEALDALLKKYSLDLNDLVRKFPNLFQIAKGEYISDKDKWQEIRNNASVEYLDMKTIVCKKLSKLYDNNYEIFKYVVLYLVKFQKNNLTFKI